MYLWIFICGLFFAFYNAWGIGANDCANSFATSVGSGVLTLRKAVIIAAIFEFSGAVLMGSHVTDMVRKKIVERDLFEDTPEVLMFGMLCSDLSSAIWLTIATYLKLPVSTTHSIIGAIVGFSMAYGGVDAVNWEKVGMVVASWVASPILSGLFSLVIFYLLNTAVFKRKNPFNKIIMLFPILTFLTFFINSLFIIYKGSPQLELDEMPFWQCFLISSCISVITALISRFVYVPYAVKRIKNLKKKDIENNIELDNVENNNLNRTDSYREAATSINNKDFKYDTSKNIQDNILMSKKYIQDLEQTKIKNEIDLFHLNAHSIDDDSEKLCSWLQIITACFSSFAHGSNDVANAIAPLATIYHIYRYGSITKKTNVPIWILLIGGIGIVFGLVTWGYKIINRMGKEITKVSASRGFIIELSAALSVIIASRAEIPVSTTHCQVGSIVGCGLVGGVKNVKWSLLKKIVMSWLVTLPVTGCLSAALFSYGYFSPGETSGNNLNLFAGNITS